MLCPSPSSPWPTSDGDGGRDLVVILSLDVPSRCWTLLCAAAREPEPGEGCGDGAQAIREVDDAAGHPLPCSITLSRGSTGSPCWLGPRPTCVSPHCPWVSIPCVVPMDRQGPHPGCTSLYHLGPPCGCLSLYCRRSPSWLHVPAPSSALCTGCGAPHWLWMPAPALSSCRLCYPAPFGSPYQQCPRAAPAERGHP